MGVCSYVPPLRRQIWRAALRGKIAIFSLSHLRCTRYERHLLTEEEYFINA